MSNQIYLLGDNKHSFICGVNVCPTNGMTLPFFGVAENSKVLKKIDLEDGTHIFEDREDVDRLINVYRETGVLIFIQHMEAAGDLMRNLHTVFSFLAEKGWTGEATPNVN